MKLDGSQAVTGRSLGLRAELACNRRQRSYITLVLSSMSWEPILLGAGRTKAISAGQRPEM
jgi:hypothetical protein